MISRAAPFVRKVAWIHTHMKFWGGGNRQVIEVSRRLAKKYELTLFIGSASSLTKPMLSEAQLKYCVRPYLSTNSAIYWSLLPAANWFASTSMRGELEDYDAVVTSYPSANMVGTAVHDRVLYYCFEPFSLFYNRVALRALPPTHRLFWEPLGTLYRSFDLKAVRRVEAVLTIDKHTAKWIERLYGRRAFVTGTGVDTDFFRPRAGQDPIFDKYSGKRVILSQTHGYSYFDGCEYLLFAVASLKREVPSIHVIFTSMFRNHGRLAFLKSLSRKLGIEANVEFIGFVEENMLPGYYGLAEAVVQPAIGTNTLLTTKEAMSCERPVVLFDGGPAEDVQGCECGIVVARESVEPLAGAIRTLLGDRELAARMGKNGRRRALERFGWDAVASRVESAIDAVRSG